MRYQAIRHAIPLVILGVTLLATATAQATDAGKNRYRYDCQVTTVSDLQGYIGVFSHSLEGAVTMAARAPNALTRQETREAAKSVVQCVRWPNGRFTDVGFQTWFEALPK